MAKRPTLPKLKTLAEQIEDLFPDLVAIVYPANHPLGGFWNTDRLTGQRIKGKGRKGSRLVVSIRPGHEATCSTPRTWIPSRTVAADTAGPIVWEHNAAETYRSNQDVVDWIAAERKRRNIPPACRGTNPHVFTLGADRCSLCGWNRYEGGQ